jgi:chemotaxis protein methyltransferase WspC
MPRKHIESLLEKEIGLSPESIGPETIAKAVQARMRATGLMETSAYLNLLRRSTAEWDELVETVVVPETWFFRNKESFTFLGLWAKRKWLSKHKGNVLRVLSMASSTGEEPYSIAMALLDAGLSERRFSIVSADISKNALRKAGLGFYGPASFRGNDISFRERYFDATSDGYQLHFSVLKTVHFVRKNVLSNQFLSEDSPYDIIFCRNLLIYLSPLARQKVMGIINRLLAKTGIFFVGHAERQLVTAPGLQLIKEPGVFAFCRAVDSDVSKAPARPKPRVKFERRRHRNEKASHARRAHAIPDSAKRPEDPVGNNSYPVTNRRQPSTKKMELLDQARQRADKGDLEEAIRLCGEVLDQDTTHAQAHYLRGLICLAMDNEEDAGKWLGKAVYLDPEHHDALNHLALIAEHRGDGKTSTQLRQRVKRLRRKEGVH